jgi:hypothetical protein
MLATVLTPTPLVPFLRAHGPPLAPGAHHRSGPSPPYAISSSSSVGRARPHRFNLLPCALPLPLIEHLYIASARPCRRSSSAPLPVLHTSDSSLQPPHVTMRIVECGCGVEREYANIYVLLLPVAPDLHPHACTRHATVA